MAKLCLIDGSGYIFRAFHALPPLNTPEGTPVNAVYGFVRAIMALQSRDDIDFIAVVFDSSRISFRQSIYKEYKAQRAATPEELIPQFSLLRDSVDSLNIIKIEKEGFEADDLIATYTELAKKEGIAVEILSSDKDLMQLVDDSKNIYMFDPLKRKIIKEAEVIEKFSVPPSKVTFVQALMGDSSDNIPGVTGIGPKTAALLIQEFGNLENIFNNINKITKETLKANLINDKDLAFTSLKLATLVKDVPIEYAIKDLSAKKPIPENLYKFLNSLSFTSLAIKVAKDANLNLKELANTNAANSPSSSDANNNLNHNSELNESSLGNLHIHNSDKPSYSSNALIIKENILISNTLEFKNNFNEEALINLANNTEIPILITDNLETTIVSLFNPSRQINYEIIIHNTAENADLLTLPKEENISINDLLLPLKPILENPAIKKIFYDLKPFLKILTKENIKLTSYEDVMLMINLCDGVIESKHTITTYLAKNFIINPSILEENLLEDKKNTHNAYELFLLYELYAKKIISIHSTYIYESFEKPLVSLLANMEATGILIDKNILFELSKKFEDALLPIENKIFALTEEKFNLASPKQIGEILFNKMNIKGTKNKSGSWKTSASFLEDLADEGFELATLILKWRQLSKLKNTYTDPLVTKINPLTKRIHTTYQQCQTSTGRLSSFDPNLQNIPIKTLEGKEIRKAFVAKLGYKIISLDYSQIELKVLAIIAEVKNLLKSFNNQEDIHKATASEIFGVSLEEVTADLRRKAKAINFGIIYGQTQHGLSSLLGISKEEAQKYIDSYFRKYPEIKQYMNETLISAKKEGYVETLFGRKCFVNNINHNNHTLKSLAERAAINARIQGTSADIMKKAMLKAHQYIIENNYKASILLQIHDEILVEAKEDIAEELALKLQEKMSKIFNLSIPLDVNYAIGNNWFDSH